MGTLRQLKRSLPLFAQRINITSVTRDDNPISLKRLHVWEAMTPHCQTLAKGCPDRFYKEFEQKTRIIDQSNKPISSSSKVIKHLLEASDDELGIPQRSKDGGDDDDVVKVGGQRGWWEGMGNSGFGGKEWGDNRRNIGLNRDESITRWMTTIPRSASRCGRRSRSPSRTHRSATSPPRTSTSIPSPPSPSISSRLNRSASHLCERFNRFYGNVPKKFKNLKILFELDISNNRSTGKFPCVVLQLPQLMFLDLRFNEFEGGVLRELFDKDLDAIFIKHNNFVFDLLDNFGNSISVIVLANNKFHGCVPASILLKPVFIWSN
ncbi:hypothetical protein RJ639_037149 [Escallonia herrerae]|uniref:Uncharacterized protein n=1 Tax=Escallonia herrerae TaxID=1293975 RepID=A0AA88WRT4_9ASTE|nr:hypothetical protein RJ639_037149 [Escallonia herrerae]